MSFRLLSLARMSFHLEMKRLSIVSQELFTIEGIAKMGMMAVRARHASNDDFTYSVLDAMCYKESLTLIKEHYTKYQKNMSPNMMSHNLRIILRSSLTCEMIVAGFEDDNEAKAIYEGVR
ncbi:hypothetical protein Tco_0946973, partial [Tanacetum coccineum]